MTSPMAEKAHNFMCRNSRKALNAQTEVGQSLRGADVSLGTLSEALKWHRNTLDSYFPANRATPPRKLPLGALWDIWECEVFPEKCKALLFPDDWCAVRAPQQIDVHEISRIVAELVALKAAAHRPDSPAGVEISDCEAEAIAKKVVELKVVA